MRRLIRLVGLVLRELLAAPLLTLIGVPDSRAHDHRGRRIRVRRRLRQNALGQPLDPDAQPAASRVSARQRTQGIRIRAKVVEALSTGVFLFLGIMLVGSYTRPPATWKQAAAAGAGVAMVLVLVNAIAWRLGIVLRGDAKELRAAWLAEGCCASCGYDLSPSAEQREPDGCTICPECGCAWDLRR